ncbi:tRNA 2-thiouridine(34) synthase MnmA [Patescibacteria group bacterium]|nr:tRNA 2-thiouridine(34) synthase MnmA [Patescibacteria group bacterium]
MKERTFTATSASSKNFARRKAVYQVKPKKLVFIAMSGGVDSSVAALLLSSKRGSASSEKKYSAVGVYIKGYNLDGCSERDSEDARRTAEKIGIPFYVWDLEKEYKELVVDYMINGYKNGITPNPDVMCNKEIKFGLFLKKAIAAGADYVATGHYVRISAERRASSGIKNLFKDGGKPKIVYKLFQAKDQNKDQSYFLWTLNQKQLSRCLFPIGDYSKPEIRKIAKRAGLPTADKKDSQGICFLGKISLSDFLKRHIRPKRGLVLNSKGKILGEHQGAYFYTIGQRHGLGIPGDNPYYVIGKNIKKNIIKVAETDDLSGFKKEIVLKNLNWISGIPRLPLSVLARLRYRQPLVKARLARTSGKYKLFFIKPQKFIAPGQSAVFYNRSGEMIGGGEIV